MKIIIPSEKLASAIQKYLLPGLLRNMSIQTTDAHRDLTPAASDR